MMSPWLSVVGIGEAGAQDLTSVARSLIDQATLLVGGTRHLAFFPHSPCEQLLWATPIESTIQTILSRRGQAVCVLATGDPLCYGIAATLLRHLPIHEMTIIPSISAFSLACSRLGWSLPQVETLSLCGRNLDLLNAVLYPGAKILLLSADRTTPAKVAQRLLDRGYQASQFVILEHLGGVQERVLEASISAIAQDTQGDFLSDLNTIALDCHATDPSTIAYSRLAGLPDDAYRHDGQLTKREVRAMTLAALAPLPGELLWDVGAGCGSIGIEWLRSHRAMRAIAIEQSIDRVQMIAHNAANLGVPNLKIITGKAPHALQNLPQPNAIFIGGGVTVATQLQTCWNALPQGGRLVVNAVTIEAEQCLFNAYQQYGGELNRIAITRAAPIGQFIGWKALSPITQWVVHR